MNIVFNINTFGLEGLGATLTSLVRNCSNSKLLNLYFLCSDLSSENKDNVKTLLKDESYEGSLEFIDFNAKAKFGHLSGLHGDWTTYGRLLIPELIDKETALYLDADLLILLDVLELKDFDFSDKIIGAVHGARIASVLDKSFFIDKLNWKLDVAYFNAGVIFMNLKKWRESEIDKKIDFLTTKFPHDLISHDQTLLNAVCEGHFAQLPNKFNVGWFPGRNRPEYDSEVIWHFIGAPKPWDFLGKIIHKGYAEWQRYNTPFWKKLYGKLTFDKLYRSWKIRRSLLKHLKNRVFR
ncbi:MAG: hypothetical protein NWQ07_10030 [Flaviramulus sp.]|nr:hypothetical protein [Flaviramulus sp.]